MWFWIITILILLIVLEEGLYFLSNHIAFDKQPKKSSGNFSEETSPSGRRRRSRR